MIENTVANQSDSELNVQLHRVAMVYPFLSDSWAATREALADGFVSDFLDRFSSQEGGSSIFIEDEWASGLRKIQWDSDHFSMPIGEMRLLCPTKDFSQPLLERALHMVDVTMTAADKIGLRHLIANVDTGDTLAQRALQRRGFLLADTVVLYRLDEIPADLGSLRGTVRPAEEKDIDSLSDISGVCFADRRYNINRFNSDPAFDADKVFDLYAKWAANSVRKKLASEVLVFEESGEPLGFITLQLPSERDLSLNNAVGRVPLNAVRPDKQGQGVYGQLVKAALRWFAERGCTAAEIGTQIPNVGVHKVWSRHKARIVSSSHRFHFHGA